MAKTTAATLGLICALAIFSGCNGGESASGNLASPAPSFPLDPGVYQFQREGLEPSTLWLIVQDRVVQAGDHVALLGFGWSGHMNGPTMVLQGTQDGDEFVVEGRWHTPDRFVGQVRWRGIQDAVTAWRVGP